MSDVLNLKLEKQLFAQLSKYNSVFPVCTALAVVSLQRCPGFSPGRPHFALQDEEQQHPHVAGGRNTGSLREKGGASLSFLLGKALMVTRGVCVSGGGCLRSAPLSHDPRHVSPRRSERLQRSGALEVPVSLP